jgi:hypothetical protein
MTVAIFRAPSRRDFLRCVFEDSDTYTRLVQQLRLRNLDSGILGPHYQKASIAIEAGTHHFDLFDRNRIEGYIEGMVAALNASPGST